LLPVAGSILSTAGVGSDSGSAAATVATADPEEELPDAAG
jgi:hypothetical protein